MCKWIISSHLVFASSLIVDLMPYTPNCSLNPLFSLSSSLLGTRGIHPNDPGKTDPYQSLPQAAVSALAQGRKKGKSDPLTGPTLSLITARFS